MYECIFVSMYLRTYAHTHNGLKYFLRRPEFRWRSHSLIYQNNLPVAMLLQKKVALKRILVVRG